MLAPDLLAILRCPVTRQPLALVPEERLGELNLRIGAATAPLRNVAGEPITARFEALLIRDDHAVAYPVYDGIPILLAEEGIVLS